MYNGYRKLLMPFTLNIGKGYVTGIRQKIHNKPNGLKIMHIRIPQRQFRAFGFGLTTTE